MDSGTVLGIQTCHAVNFATAVFTCKTSNTPLLIAWVEAKLFFSLELGLALVLGYYLLTLCPWHFLGVGEGNYQDE